VALPLDHADPVYYRGIEALVEPHEGEEVRATKLDATI
jgi:hypothetical protein